MQRNGFAAMRARDVILASNKKHRSPLLALYPAEFDFVVERIYNLTKHLIGDLIFEDASRIDKVEYVLAVLAASWLLQMRCKPAPQVTAES
jgi:hypothetical protein